MKLSFIYHVYGWFAALEMYFFVLWYLSTSKEIWMTSQKKKKAMRKTCARDVRKMLCLFFCLPKNMRYVSTHITYSSFLIINPFVPNAPFLYPRKHQKALTIFWCFQGVEKGCIGNEWVKFRHVFLCSEAIQTAESPELFSRIAPS